MLIKIYLASFQKGNQIINPLPMNTTGKIFLLITIINIYVILYVYFLLKKLLILTSVNICKKYGAYPDSVEL